MASARADDGVSISYRTVGSGPADVLFVHCWGNSSAAYADLLKVFDAAGLRLIVPDLRGTGESGRPETGYSLERYAKDMAAVLQDAKSNRAVVVGHSMGGQIAMLLAAGWPDLIAGQVLLCPVPPDGSPLDAATISLLRDSSGNRQATKTIYGFGSPKLSGDALERMLDDAATVAKPAIQEGFDAWSKANIVSRLGAIRCPTLLVATDDPFYSLEHQRAHTLAHIPGARLSYLPDCGHWCEVERPREVAAILQAFLAGCR